MISVSSKASALVGALLIGTLVLAATPAFSAPTTTTVAAPTTVTVSVPGTFAGCGYYDTATSPLTRAVLDLIRPSAFTSNVAGIPVGASGPIGQAELTSLDPQTVQYTVNPGFTWSNGQPFTADDLVAWFTKVRNVPSARTDGYRDISTFTESVDKSTVTAIFKTPFADWNTLFRDIDFRGVPLHCSFSSFVERPSLGPYEVLSVSHDAMTLTVNPRWTGPAPGFTYVILRSSLSTLPSTSAVDFRNLASTSYLTHVSSRSNTVGRIGPSDQIVSLGFSATRPTTSSLAVRQFLGWALNRQTLINDQWGNVTYVPALSGSSVFPQNSPYRQAPVGLGPFQQSSTSPLTTTPTSTNQDCTECAGDVLRSAGYSLRHGRWFTPAGSPLHVSLVVGPGAVNATAADLVVKQWREAGVNVHVSRVASDQLAAGALKKGHADTGIFTIVASGPPGQVVRSWTGTDYYDGYDTGWRSTQIDQWYAAAEDTYNPLDAATTYGLIDQYINTQAWQRPLFTPPVFMTSTNDVGGVLLTSSLSGFVDQIPTWLAVTNGSATS